MTQTFYVSVDEEVNSIISKLRKTSAKRNILVISRRALILQSSVSLRLIKNEMDSLGKKILIVTQDEQGLAMAEKIGFTTRRSMEGIKKEGQVVEANESSVSFVEKNKQVIQKNEEVPKKTINKHNRLKNLGTKKFASVSGIIKKTNSSNQNNIPKKNNIEIHRENTNSEMNIVNDNIDIGNNDLKLKKEKETDFRDLFVDVEENDLTEKKKENRSTIAKKSRKLLGLFGLAVASLLVGIAVYLLFPKATVSINPREIQKNINLTVLATDNTSNIEENEADDDTITLKAESIEKEETLSLTFDATGDKTSSNQKARGKITIYNNFSETSQILVATTRFLTENGKLFRLTKTITVPGMTIENGNKKPGEIEAGVIADKAGEEYNIEATKFSIPGFKGSPKYDKFFAKSSQAMKGGGIDGGELKTVAGVDIKKAKQKTEKVLKEQIENKMKKEIGEDEVLLDGAIKFEILDSAVFPEEGAVTDNFEYQVKIKAQGLYFSDDELDNKIKDYIDKNIAPQDYSTKTVVVEKKYDKPDVDFDGKTLKVHLRLNVLLKANIDSDKMKRDLSGKGQRQIDALVNRHPEIQKLEAEISPSIFANKIPKYTSRIKINIIDN